MRQRAAESPNVYPLEALLTVTAEYSSPSASPHGAYGASTPLGLKADVLVYVALSEEFDYVADLLRENFVEKLVSAELPEVALTYYRTCYQGLDLVFLPAGSKGPTRAASACSMALARFRPHALVVIGIAGALKDDVQPGDVLIPASIQEYMANSAAEGDESLEFYLAGNHYKPDRRILDRFANFRNSNRSAFDRWCARVRRARDDLFDERTRNTMESDGLISRWDFRIIAGNDRVLASGPTVGKGLSFVKWLRSWNRELVALEMESAGVFDAADLRVPTVSVIAIRGISDFADERKARLEIAAGKKFRQLATANAVALFMESIEAGFFSRLEEAEASEANERPEGAIGNREAHSVTPGSGRDAGLESTLATGAAVPAERRVGVVIQRNVAWLQNSSEMCWRFEVSTRGNVVGTAVILPGQGVDPSAEGVGGASLAISPDGDLAVTLDGCDAQLWELNPNTGKSSPWTRRQVLNRQSNSRVLAVRGKGDFDAWLALENGGKLVLATGFGKHRSLRTLLVQCGRRPVRAAFSRTSLIFLTDGEGGCLLHELLLGQTEPTDRRTATEWNLLDMDVANVNGSMVTALLVERSGSEMIIVDAEGRQLSRSVLDGTPSLLGVVRAPTQPLESLCVVVANSGEIEAHFPLRSRATAT